MTQERRKRPGQGPLSGNTVVTTDCLDTPRDKRTAPKNQPGDLGGLRPIGPIAAEVVANLRFRREVERMCHLGSRTVYEFLTEIGEQRLCRTYLEQRIRRYADIDPEHLAACGGDTFPRPPLYGVQP